MTYQEERERLEELKRNLRINHAAYVKSFEETIAFIDVLLKKAVYCESYDVVKRALTNDVLSGLASKELHPMNSYYGASNDTISEEKEAKEVISYQNDKFTDNSSQSSNNGSSESAGYYTKLKEDEKKVVDDFMHKYHTNTLLKADKMLKIGKEFGRELPYFNKEAWDSYSKKDQLILQEDDSGMFAAYRVPNMKDGYFLIPSKAVKFCSNRVIMDGFAGFFHFDLSMAIDGKTRTPYVERPALVIDRNGQYKLCLIEHVPCKGQIEF